MVGDMGFKFSDQEPMQQPESESVQQEPNMESESEQMTSEPVLEKKQEEVTVKQPQSSLSGETPSEDIEARMFELLSEKLGRQITSLDEIQGTQNTSVDIDERVAAINEFVKNTGRNPEDWFTYQSMNPSEMDDLGAVKAQLKNQYSGLSSADIDLLIENKYNLDADIYDENEVRLSQIQLKIDADKARQEIEGLRSQFAAPVKKDEVREAVVEEPESFIDDNWLNTMSAEVDALDGIEFEVSKDKSFTFGLDDSYKSTLKSKNENIEDFFSAYTDSKGQWNFEKWNMHQAVLDNIETIVKTAYQQGLGEGQRALVEKAANVQHQQPSQAGNPEGNVKSIEDQIRQAFGMNDNGLTFKI
jgi:hypothetical protein